jgi:glycogen operon protein
MSIGVPMFVMGDEVRRSQGGNNNAYCQDNETSWFDWTLLERHAGIHRFARMLIARRLRRDTTHERERRSLNELLRQARIGWSGVEIGRPDWSPASHSLAFTAEMQKEGVLLHAMLNAYWEPLEFELPAVDGNPDGAWHRWIDTALDPPEDITDWWEAPAERRRSYRVDARAVALLFAKAQG